MQIGNKDLSSDLLSGHDIQPQAAFDKWSPRAQDFWHGDEEVGDSSDAWVLHKVGDMTALPCSYE